MTISKAWNWNKEINLWLNPCEESYFIANRWKQANFRKLLDFGCGLGRHSIYFAKQGFDVSAFDLSPEAIANLKSWSEHECLDIDMELADMLELPYSDNSFDCLFAYHVVSHTDTRGMQTCLKEIKRILKKDGEFYLTLCSKDSWSYKEANFPKLDENTIIKTTENGVEIDVPHFYVSLDDILKLLEGFFIINIRHIDDCYFDGMKRNNKHYYILGKCS